MCGFGPRDGGGGHGWQRTRGLGTRDGGGTSRKLWVAAATWAWIRRRYSNPNCQARRLRWCNWSAVVQEDFSASPLEIPPSRAHPDWTREDGNAFAREHKQILGPASLFGGRLTSERERMAAQVFQTGYRFCPMRMKNPTDASI
ncbi:uncharacterized protein [Miscanthus floridulus]|uniref:uncharacterized protein n=1 Tax=Miscanthus floridulus TaxID=154761 RepID=UPI00345A205E